MTDRKFSFLDKACLFIDQVVRTMANVPLSSGAAYPAAGVTDEEMSDSQKQHCAGLMRINHTGEVCAQALYHGQAAASRTRGVQDKMQQAALEEGDHLNWCKKRLDELGSHTSYLNPFWYAGSFCIGMVAGMIGDRWSLGFVAETERQVIKHLSGHLAILPMQDQRSYHILKRMEQDEAEHRDAAMDAGAYHLPKPVQTMMALSSKVMVKTTYYI